MRTIVARLAGTNIALAAAMVFAATAIPTVPVRADSSSPAADSQPAPATAAPSGNAAATAPASQPAASAPATAPSTGPAISAPLSSGSVSVPVPSGGSHSHKVLSRKKSLRKTAGKKHPAAVNNTSFIGQVNASQVNVRSGPRLAYYPVGQLTRGDLVKVVGTVNSWDRIAAPAGTRCYISRQFVQISATGDTGHVSADYVYLRAASPLTPHSHYAVVGLVRRGTHVSITGQTKSFYIIRPPHGTDFYVASQFITPAPATATYITPRISMPAGFKGPGLASSQPTGNGMVAASTGAGGQAAPSTAPSGNGGNGQVIPIPSGGTPAPAAGQTSSGGGIIPIIPGVGKASPATAPAAAPVKYDTNAYTAFSRLNRATQKEFRKPVLQRQLAPLLKKYKALAAEPNLPPSVKQGTAEWIKEINNGIQVQKLAESAEKTPAIGSEIAPYQQKWEQSQHEVNQAVTHAPYLAKGILKTSDAIHDYALVSPSTGRVVAYLKPASKIDISKLLGSYIGVKGVVDGKTGVMVRLIDVYTATLLPLPRPAGHNPAGGPTVP